MGKKEKPANVARHQETQQKSVLIPEVASFKKGYMGRVIEQYLLEYICTKPGDEQRQVKGSGVMQGSKVERSGTTVMLPATQHTNAVCGSGSINTCSLSN